MNLLFRKGLEQHFQNRPLAASDLGIPLLNEDTTSEADETVLLDIEEVVELFASFVVENYDEDTIDMGEAFSLFQDHFQITDEDGELIAGAILQMTDSLFEDTEDPTVFHFLQQLSKPLGKPEMTSANKQGTGMTPLAGEKSVQDFLKTYAPVSKFPDAFGNKSFSSDQHKYFPRGENRFGHEAEGHGGPGYNNQKSSRPLANPTLNVDTKNRAYESIDAVGLGNITHYRVLDRLRGVYVTNQLHKEQADQIARDLNSEAEQVLAENPQLVEDFERATKEPSAIPATQLQTGLNDHRNISKYAAFINKQNHNWTSAGSLQSQKTDPVGAKAIDDWKSAQRLINENHRDDVPNEMDALNARSTGRRK
jgi:hypothetical protein